MRNRSRPSDQQDHVGKIDKGHPGIGTGRKKSDLAFSENQALPTRPPLDVALQAIGSYLRSMRESLGLTQEQVAASTEGRPWTLSRATIGSIEKGQTSPQMVSIVAITEVLHIDPMEIIDRLKLAVAPPSGTEEMSWDDLDRQWRTFFHAGHFRETLAVLDRMAGMISGQTNTKEVTRRRAALELSRATTLKRLGALTAAKGSAERAITLSTEYPELHADSLTALSSIHVRLGNIPLGVHTANTAVELSANCGPGVACRALIEKGYAYWESQEYELARQAVLSARDLAKDAQDHQHMIHCEGNIGACLAKLGRWKHAEIQVTNALELSRTHKRPEKEALWLVELGRIVLAGERFDEAYGYAEMALHMAQERELWGIAFRAVMLQHRVVRIRNPREPDRHRLQYLKKLYSWMEEHTVDEDVADFLKEVGEPPAFEKEGES